MFAQDREAARAALEADDLVLECTEDDLGYSVETPPADDGDITYTARSCQRS